MQEAKVHLAARAYEVHAGLYLSDSGNAAGDFCSIRESGIPLPVVGVPAIFFLVSRFMPDTKGMRA
jgi:hypothetical protein